MSKLLHDPPSRPWLRTREIARALGVAHRTAQHWTQLGRFPGAVRGGDTERGNWWVPAADVHAARVELGIDGDGGGS